MNTCAPTLAYALSLVSLPYVPGENSKKSENSKFEPGLSDYYEHAFISYQYGMWTTICFLVPGSSNFRGGPGD